LFASTRLFDSSCFSENQKELESTHVKRMLTLAAKQLFSINLGPLARSPTNNNPGSHARQTESAVAKILPLEDFLTPP
jgi:hypothetical protein